MKGDSWRTLIADEMVLVGAEVRGGQADLGLCAVVRWGAKATGREGGGGEDRGRIKAATPPVLFKPAVINDKTHRRTRHAS